MRTERSVLAVVTLSFLVAAVVSGPAIAEYSLTPDRPTEPTEGTLSASDAKLINSTVVVRYSEAKGYYVKSPTVTLNLTSVEGRPVLNYIANSSGTRFFWTLTLAYPRETGEVTFGGERKQVPEWVATNESYSGRVRVVVRGADGRRVLFREPIEIVTSREAAEAARSDSS